MAFVYLFERPDIAIDPNKPVLVPAVGLPLVRHLMKPGRTELALCTYRVRLAISSARLLAATLTFNR